MFLEEDLMLCDCPGLVFPNANSSREEMILNGVIPIHNLREVLQPLDLLCNRIPFYVIASVYKIPNDPDKVHNGLNLIRKFATCKRFFS